MLLMLPLLSIAVFTCSASRKRSFSASYIRVWIRDISENDEIPKHSDEGKKFQTHSVEMFELASEYETITQHYKTERVIRAENSNNSKQLHKILLQLNLTPRSKRLRSTVQDFGTHLLCSLLCYCFGLLGFNPRRVGSNPKQVFQLP